MVLAALKLNGFELKFCTATLQADKEAESRVSWGWFVIMWGVDHENHRCDMHQRIEHIGMHIGIVIFKHGLSQGFL